MCVVLPDGAYACPAYGPHQNGTLESPSKAPIDKPRGRVNGLRCLSPQGELAKHAACGDWRLGIAARRRDRGPCFFDDFLARARKSFARRGESRPMADRIGNAQAIRYVLTESCFPYS